MTQTVDLSANETFVDGFVFDFFAELRAREGLYWHGPTGRAPDGFWVVSRYDDVVAVLSNPAQFCTAGNAVSDPADESLNTIDGARHRHLRRLAEESIAAALRDYASTAQQRADEFVDHILLMGAFDMVDVAQDFGSHILFDLLGVPPADRAQLIAWTYGAPGERSDEARRQYYRDLIAERAVKPGGDVVSTLLQKISESEVLAFVNLIYPAGASASASALAGAVKAFCDTPEQFGKLVKHPGVRNSAVEEILRWTTPPMYSRRVARTDVALGGSQVLAGQMVTAWLASANRDERIFADPERFDVARSPNPHLSFGGGPHVCPGPVAPRAALLAFLEAVRTKVTGFELMGEASWVADDRFQSLASLPVRLTAQ